MTKGGAFGLLLILVPLLSAQQTDNDVLRAASARLRAALDSGDAIASFGKTTRAQLNEYENIVRDWLEAHLPSDSAGLDPRFSALQSQLAAELWRAGALDQSSASSARNGDVSELKFDRPIEDPNVLLVRVGVSVPCGRDEFVLIYRFTGNSRIRLLEAHGESKWGNTVMDTKFSEPDAYGTRLFYVSWYGVQCASVWNGIDYRLFRIGGDSSRAVQLFGDTHGFTIDGDVNVKVARDELLLEMTDSAMEGGFRRTHVLHYRIGPESVQRIDPVALQPQDFVHEWLSRSWGEMESRSNAAVAKWHKFLHADYVFGEYEFVQPCKERPGVTQVRVGLRQTGDREIPEPMIVHFLVEDKGEYQFRLIDVSFDRQPGCPGETSATYDNAPSLFKKQ